MPREPSTIRHALAVDPGCGITAWALLEQVRSGLWELQRYNQLRRPTVPKLQALLAKLAGAGVELEGLHLVIEGQWFRPTGKNAGVNHYNVQALAEQRRTWQVIVEVVGGTHEVVDPNWVRKVSKGCPICPDFEKERDSVRRLISAGRARWPGLASAQRPEGPRPDEWASILLADFWCRENGHRLTRPAESTTSTEVSHG